MSGGDNYSVVIRDDVKKGVRRNIGLGLTVRSSNANTWRLDLVHKAKNNGKAIVF